MIRNGEVVCNCPAPLIGNPYQSCRPECIVNSDCTRDSSCVRQKCVDPCKGTCGVDASCKVSNHNPVCSCPEGYSGDPFSRCIQITIPSKNLIVCFSDVILLFGYHIK